jgi:rhodanese-related sulfurtransferase
MRRISPQALNERLRGPNPPVVVDTRSDHAYEEADRRIPGDYRVSQAYRDEDLDRLPRGHDYVTYCT